MGIFIWTCRLRVFWPQRKEIWGCRDLRGNEGRSLRAEVGGAYSGCRVTTTTRRNKTRETLAGFSLDGSLIKLIWQGQRRGWEDHKLIWVNILWVIYIYTRRLKTWYKIVHFIQNYRVNNPWKITQTPGVLIFLHRNVSARSQRRPPRNQMSSLWRLMSLYKDERFSSLHIPGSFSPSVLSA